MQWGDESSIGFNAGADYYENHPITGHIQAHFIACLQNNSGSAIKNQIYDLVPDPSSLIPGAIPPYHNTIGNGKLLIYVYSIGNTVSYLQVPVLMLDLLTAVIVKIAGGIP